MEARTRLEAALVAESEAYGYTLSVWGAGALLIHAFGVPGVERAVAHVAGALVWFAGLVLLAFRGLSADADVEGSPSSLVASTVHVVATGGTLAVVHLFLALAGDVRQLVAFFATGVLVTVAYNLLLLVEELVADRSPAPETARSPDQAPGHGASERSRNAASTRSTAASSADAASLPSWASSIRERSA
jgi:hypothetical protein